jgi:AcrR family transcriptional regulator
MHNGRVTIASLRRTEIVDAAVAVINEQGIQNLSLSEIEKKVGMSRGQLTYYYKTKEDIFLAVFDRLLHLMCEQHGEDPANGQGRNGKHPFARLDWLDIVRHLFDIVLQESPAHPEFHALQYTFLSQISHRADFRNRLADLYEEWRHHLAEDLRRHAKKRPTRRPVSPRAMATLVQALLHGLAVQRAADPSAVRIREITALCLDMLETYLWGAAPTKKSRPSKSHPRRPSRPRVGRGVSYARNRK